MTKAVQKLFNWKSYQRKKILAITILSVAVLLPFLTKFSNQFVWDDHEFIVDNPAIRTLSHIPSFFAQPVVNLYRPLRTTFYAAAYPLFERHPFGYHLAGWALHLGCVFLLFALLRRLKIPDIAALLASILFAVHPIHTESVTFITASFDLLGPFLFLLAFVLFLGNQKWRPFSWLCYALALLSSEMTITLPLLIAVVLFHQRENKSAVARRLFPFFLVAAAYLILRFGILGIGARDSQFLGGSFTAMLASLPRIGAEYVRLLLWPFPLLADYRHFPIVTSFLQPAFWLSFLFLASLTALFIWRRRQNPWFLLGWIWLWVALLPVSNLIPIGVPMAERYLYIPSIGLCLAAALPLAALWKKKKIAAAALLSLLAVTTGARNLDWKNDLALWTATSLTAPESFVAHNNLGSQYTEKGLYNTAYEEIMAALKLKPDFVDAHTNLGTLFEKRGMWKEARISYENAVALNPSHAPSRCNLGNMYLKEGNNKEAMISYRKAVEINPNFYIAHYNMGNLLFKEENLEEAEKFYRKALEIQPAFADARHNLAVLEYQRRLRQSTRSGEAMNTLE